MKKAHGEKHNSVIGYVVVDINHKIICSSGTDIDPAFCARERALLAGERYRRTEEVFKAEQIYLEWIFKVVVWDEGDIMLDGQSAQRFVKACMRRGLKRDKRGARTINRLIQQGKCSVRKLLGDMDFNRAILLTHP